MGALTGIALLLAAGQVQETTTSQCSWVGRQWVCRTTEPFRLPPPTNVDVGSILRSLPPRTGNAADPQPSQHARTSAISAEATPSARDLYIGCSLLISGEELRVAEPNGFPAKRSAAMCAALSTIMLAKPDMASPAEQRICAPASLRESPVALAAAYVEAYDGQLGAGRSETHGPTVLRYVASRRWPCK
jgi:hypothetical protein